MAPISIIFFICSLLLSPLFGMADCDIYIVHMDLSLMPKVFSSHHHWYQNTVSSAVAYEKASDFSSIVYSYTEAIHGFSAMLSPEELEAVKKSPGYVSSTRDIALKLDTTHSPEFIGLNPNYGAWSNSEFGRDIIIGIVDTGIWPESKSFDDHGMTEVPSRWKGVCENGTQFDSSLCNKKLIGARYFNKGLRAQKPNLKISMNSARDTNGHGTHTSSTAAGNFVGNASYFGYASGTAKGMAPHARLAMYKVIWGKDMTQSDLLAALDQAILDGVDILSLSLGNEKNVPLYGDPIAIATFAALKKNIFVSTSAGNDGPSYKTLHNDIPWVLTVAAGSVDRQFAGRLTLGNGVSVSGLSMYPEVSSSPRTSLVFMNACSDQNALSEMGMKTVVCLDNNGTLLESQVINVMIAKVPGAIFITNSTKVDDVVESDFPALFLKLEDGPKILEYINKSSDPEATLQFGETIVGSSEAPIVAGYSSRGPSVSCPFVMKPDIMAPGSYILASWSKTSAVTFIRSRELHNDFNIISGTSMSCPHLAGVAALLKAVHPDWSPAAIRSAMMTTADRLDNRFNRIEDEGIGNQVSTPLAMGAGHINPNRALDPGLIYDATPEDYINLLCGLSFTSRQIQIITRSSENNCPSPSLDVNYPSVIAYFNANLSESTANIIHEFKRTVTNVGDAAAVYNVKLSQIVGIKIGVVPDKLVFTKKYEKKSFNLSIEGSGQLKDLVLHGSLTWVETGGKHVVAIPIVVTSLNVKTLT